MLFAPRECVYVYGKGVRVTEIKNLMLERKGHMPNTTRLNPKRTDGTPAHAQAMGTARSV